MSEKTRSAACVASILCAIGGTLTAGVASHAQEGVRLTYVSYGGTGQDAQIRLGSSPT